jgi:predicted RNase H-like HicB family nuclease
MNNEESAVVIEKVAYGVTIGDNKFGNSRPGIVEATLKPGKTLEDALDELDDRLNAWHRKKYPHLYQEGNPEPSLTRFPPPLTGPAVIETIDYKQKESLEIAIDNATSLESLAEIKEACGKAGLVSQYMKKLNELMVKP